ncbi:response regulator transcription factor [Citricoccus sp. I39-566]|uniref:winged helix-turn-helix transcriptional regulator n=1 Tax=Citricoccus sp. I39-566 TaxID=3073268 RepID=UPI00286B464D|nr:response regulator transcription factor [Citricoccus sp. I39-566]WMY78198.1 response regulator transcription factor [Citricoccus sp. I39-566]
MALLLMLSGASDRPEAVLESLAFLDHRTIAGPPRAETLLRYPDADVVLVDARRDLTGARSLCRALAAASPDLPLLPVLTEGGLAGFSPAWGPRDFLLDTAGPAEVTARLRLATQPRAEDGASGSAGDQPIRASGIFVDASTYTAQVHGEPMNLTFKEFELLKHLVQHPGRVFTREQLLHEVWGYDYFGGTRTVDVHVRRLRAKLGPDQEQLIGTVRNVGYRFVPREPRENGASND